MCSLILVILLMALYVAHLLVPPLDEMLNEMDWTSFIPDLISQGVFAVIFAVFFTRWLTRWMDNRRKPKLTMQLRRWPDEDSEKDNTVAFRAHVINDGRRFLPPGMAYWHIFVPAYLQPQVHGIGDPARVIVGGKECTHFNKQFIVPVFQELPTCIGTIRVKSTELQIDEEIFYFFSTEYGMMPEGSVKGGRTYYDRIGKAYLTNEQKQRG